MPYKARSSVLAAAALSALVLSACGGEGDDSASDSGMNLVSEGTLTVCSDIPYVPFEYEENGEYVGFDMDLIKEIASGMDLNLEVKDSGFDGLQSGTVLAAGQCDLIASAMTITEERQERMAFSDPYYDSLQSILVPEGSDITGIEDLAGRNLGVQQGTTGEAYAREQAPDAKISSFQSDGELFPALQSGQVEAVLQDLPVNLEHTRDGEFTIAAKFETDESYGFAMSKTGSEELVSAVNEQLAALRDNGKYQEIYDKYFTE
ncbi:basic amino acid ABC transporter substrate-binding protein [Arthrobacter sp. Sa2BUA2]|uniref:Basic amino acid ABC transporter substrate-binding protein n=1 Tax=Arthrobacter pullicola TaxID=2762224 RepID=A0ABR8YJS0_9MICC|nr:basic amino acid ABC transporter substrate-binding protein [Arthrobacter pullicola]MBD8044436.1 basic amino acid ABC transporter substrate-binding protein [Arthrobacter pullicola]